MDSDSLNMLLHTLVEEQDKRAVLVRTALRGLGTMLNIGAANWGGDTPEESVLEFKLQALRAVFVCWCEITYEGVESNARIEAFKALQPLLVNLDATFPDFYKRNMLGSDYALASFEDRVRAGRRGLAFVEAINNVNFTTPPADIKINEQFNKNLYSILDTVTYAGPYSHVDRKRWRETQYRAIEADVQKLHKKELIRTELILAPLWPDAKSAALATNLCPLRWFDIEFSLETWLKERKDGALVMGMPPQVMAERMVTIANSALSFWEGGTCKKKLQDFSMALFGAGSSPGLQIEAE